MTKHIQSIRRLHGVGVSCVNALSSISKTKYTMYCLSTRIFRRQSHTDVHIVGDSENTGTSFPVQPDATILKRWNINIDLSNRIYELAYLNKGLWSFLVQTGRKQQNKEQRPSPPKAVWANVGPRTPIPQFTFG